MRICNNLNKHIILLGFKHVGKSIIAKHLAERLHLPSVDLDQQIELSYQKECGELANCRQIMQKFGEGFFRSLEQRVLRQVVTVAPSIIALGGGTPLCPENQSLLQPFILIHITAPIEIIAQRIKRTGVPAFLEQDSFDGLQKLYDERLAIYKKISSFSIQNSGLLEEALTHIMQKLRLYLEETL